MDRNDEFLNLMNELNKAPPELEHTVQRAKAKARSRKRTLNWIVAPLGTVAAAFALFVLLVNSSVTFANAVADIPVLGDLAAAVNWSGSLSRAVDKGYVQTIGQTRAGDGFVATVEYAILDLHQVHIFYNIKSVDPEKEYATVSFELVDAPPHALTWQFSDGGLEHLTVDFSETTVPDTLTLTMYVVPTVAVGHESEPPASAAIDPQKHDDPREGAQTVTFELALDMDFITAGETIDIGQWVELDGQRIYVDSLEVYPSNARLKLANDPDNELILKGLYFYLEDERGNRYETEGGLSGLSNSDTGFYFDSRVSSPYFTDPKHLTLYITGAEWLDESKSAVTVDIAGGTATGLPEGATYEGTNSYPGEDFLALVFRVPRLPNGGVYGSLFQLGYTDPTGETHEVTSGGSSSDDDKDTFEAMFLLPLDYKYDTVTLDLTITQWGSFDQPVTVEIK